MSAALEYLMQPLQGFLNTPAVSEICINRAGEIWVEDKGRFVRHEIHELDEARLMHLATLTAELNHKHINPDKPLLSATLTQGERCQFVLPPACDKTQFVCSIRKPAIRNMTLDDWKQQGAFSSASRSDRNILLNAQLKQLLQAGDWFTLMKYAVKSKLNIVICGGTSTAKTTFLNSCIKEIPLETRLITVEGVREVTTDLPNVVHLLANEDEDRQTVSMLDLLKTCFRLRPDRIFLSELRAQEAYPFLRACISGHPGSLTTLHADSIESAFEQLCFMLSESEALKHAPEARLKSLINQAVHVMVQMARHDNGARVVEAIHLNEVR